jgi:hypothetical protein
VIVTSQRLFEWKTHTVKHMHEPIVRARFLLVDISGFS